MPTHSIGAGRTNFPVTLPIPERQKLGRLATLRGERSTNAFVRGLIFDAIQQAEQRGLQLARDARQLTLTLTTCAAIAFGFGACLIQAITGDCEPRRPALVRTVRGSRREDLAA